MLKAPLYILCLINRETPVISPCSHIQLTWKNTRRHLGMCLIFTPLLALLCSPPTPEINICLFSRQKLHYVHIILVQSVKCQAKSLKPRHKVPVNQEQNSSRHIWLLIRSRSDSRSADSLGIKNTALNCKCIVQGLVLVGKMRQCPRRGNPNRAINV